MTIDAGDGLPLTLPATWRRRAGGLVDSVLLANEQGQLTYAEADRRSSALARGLLAAGVLKGSHIAILFPNGPQFIIAMLAAARIGAVVVPLSTLSTPDELRWLLAKSDTAHLLAARTFRSHDYVAKLGAALPDLDFTSPGPQRTCHAPWLRGVWFDGPSDDDIGRSRSLAALAAQGQTIAEQDLYAVEDRVNPSDRFVMIHTSGSTAHPKAVIHQHGSLLRHLHNSNLVRGFGTGDAMFSTAPWFWVAGFAAALTATIVAGAKIIDSNSADPAEALDMLERERPTHTNGYPGSVARLVEHPGFAGRDLSSIRSGTIWSLHPPDIRPRDFDLRAGSYGMTEAGGSLAVPVNEIDLPESKRGAFGEFLPGYEHKFVDPETGAEVPDGVVGELWLRSPLMMEGYYGKARCEVFEPDGWWRSGDLGWMDADGLFYFKGRLGDMIKSAGANVAPREVEAVMRMLAGGRQCHVVGIPDTARGEAVAAAIVVDDRDEVDVPALQRQLAEKLSSYKVPRSIVALRADELPMLPSGKLDMAGLKASIASRVAADHQGAPV